MAASSQSQKVAHSLEELQTARRRQLGHLSQELAQWRQRHTGATERAALLDELEKRHEGVGAGAKEVLLQSRSDGAGALRHVRGLVADLLHVNVDTAPLIEVALGEAAQFVVVDPGSALFDQLRRGGMKFAGRVGFLRTDVPPPRLGTEPPDLQGRTGVLGRADQLVDTEPEYRPLAERLLGRTWIVDSLSDALALSNSIGRGLTFVTRAGELVNAEGVVAVGPRQAATGLISRRSELRALRQQIAELTTQIDQRQAECAALEQEIETEDSRIRSLLAENKKLGDALAEQRLKTGAADERLLQMDRQYEATHGEVAAAEADYATAATSLADAQAKLAQTELLLADLEARIQETTAHAARTEQVRQRHQREVNASKVELAKSEQQLSTLQTQEDQLHRVNRNAAVR
jgi:chromosome segregation protein